jgi:PKHD-type hydroxylase
MVTNYGVYPGALSKEFCDLICNAAKSYPEKDAVVGGGIVDKKIRSSYIHWIPEYKHPEISTVIDWYLKSVNRDRLGFDVSYGAGNYQYTEYHASENGHYGWHIDCMYNNDAISDRKVSLCVHLSDPSEYEGGEFCMDTCATPKFNPSDFKKQGSVIVFPSYIKHCVTPVTKGVRKSLVVWYNGPRFR